MSRFRAKHRGSILVFVLAVLAMMTILGASYSKSVHIRSLSARDPGRGGTSRTPRATIEDGANGAPPNEDGYGSQTIPAGGDDRLRGGHDR